MSGPEWKGGSRKHLDRGYGHKDRGRMSAWERGYEGDMLWDVDHGLTCRKNPGNPLRN